MIDVMSMCDVRTNPAQQLAQAAACLERIDDFRQARQFLRQRIIAIHLQVVDEILRPRRWVIPGMLHRERDDVPAELFEHTIVREEDGLRPAAVVVVVVDGEQRAQCRSPPVSMSSARPAAFAIECRAMAYSRALRAKPARLSASAMRLRTAAVSCCSESSHTTPRPCRSSRRSGSTCRLTTGTSRIHA